MANPSGEDNSGQFFSSRWGLLLSVLGIAVGTGNIWRFPRIAAQNGGDEGAGAFLVAWLSFLLLWSIPLIIAEYAMGRSGRMGTIGTFARIAGSKLAWMGGFVGLVATAIMFYYSVVAGWCLHYLSQTVLGTLPADAAQAKAGWDAFHAGGQPLLFHAMAMGFGGVAVFRGIRSIERVNRVLIPILLGIVVVSLLRAVTLEGAGEGIAYLFTPQWSQLSDPRVWLEALTQNAWDTGAGWGLILTYAACMRRQDGVVKNAFMTGVGNNLVSLMAAITVFGTVFAVLGAQMDRAEVLAVMRQSGPASTGLTFIWMPQLFAKMALGSVMAPLFFLGLSFAALSSLISMIELATRLMVDAGVPRPRAVLVVCGAGFGFGVPSALNLDVFANQDFVWGVGLIISGALIATALIVRGVSGFRIHHVDDTPGDWKGGAAWEWAIRVVVPVQAVALLIWWLFQSATSFAPDTWYDPFDPYSVASCLMQWGLVAAGLLVFNRAIVKRTAGAEDPVVDGDPAGDSSGS